MNNTVRDVRRMSVAELLDGRMFYIPDYQRGYRWTSQQVEELLQDLLVFAINEKDSSSYYCLQPIVVRNDSSNGRLEVIDGQQRLTTLKIILHYLKQRIDKIDPEEWSILGVDIYSINYATRPKSNDFIEKLGTSEDVFTANEPIDYYYMRNAYSTIANWFAAKDVFKGKGAPFICDRLGTAKDAARSLIKDICVRRPQGSNPTVQVLWYEVEAAENSIKLFNRLNTGKLELTDAELIKGLFLLRANFKADAQRQDNAQFQQAVQWECMENTLHNDAFWSFLTPRRYDVPNRIDLLLGLVYRSAFRPDGKISQNVKESIGKKHSVFNYYNDIFNIELKQRQKVVEEEWAKIEDAFSALEDWYSNPTIYNLVGMICQTKTAELSDIYLKYCDLKSERKNRSDFIKYLKDLIRDHFKGVSYWHDKSGYHIDLMYGKDEIFDLLLLLNVVHMNKRASESDLKSGEIEQCKFPFAVLVESWDIEHVDSQTTNDLSEPEVKSEWIQTSLIDLEDQLTAAQKSEVAKLKASNDADSIDKLIQYIRCEIAHEDDLGEDKDNIWNLVLLDAGTNRSYKNSLFVSKRKKIIERRELGQFVPETTSYVFFKLFEKSASSRWRWGRDDMQVYVNYIVSQLQGYLPAEKEVK